MNRVYKRSGSVWEGRFKASLIQAEEYLLTCHRYIELNPVRADMVRDPGAYRWSSYPWHGLGADQEGRRAAYRALFRAHLDDEALDEIRKATSRGLPVGSDRFREQVEAALGRRIGLRPRGRREAESSNAVLPGQMGLDL